MRVFSRTILALALVAFGPAGAGAQDAQVAFGGLKQDTTLPVEITAAQLQVDQADGSATFTGDVIIGQGDMRISAAKVRVEYSGSQSDGTGTISRLLATGGVTMVNGAEAAESREAVYTISSGNVVMTGDVILTQGSSAISGNRLVIDLKSGTGSMEGRVKTILQTGSN